jgi:hypothetical protein
MLVSGFIRPLQLQVDLGQKEAAIKSLESAQVSANKIEDKQLKAEIDALLESVLAGQEEQ